MTVARLLAARFAALGIRPEMPFRNAARIEEALTHSSYTAEYGGAHNERLEMLGDSILGFCVADLLFEALPSAVEGVLTRRRAALVQEAALAARARTLGLQGLVRLGRGEAASGGAERDALLADTFEAVVAALYLSEGLDVVRMLVDRLFRAEAQETNVNGPIADTKTALQERTQAAWRVQPMYVVTSERGADHDRTFVVDVLLDGEVVGSGEGRSKKQAEQRAAAAALAQWDDLVRRRVAGRPPRA